MCLIHGIGPDEGTCDGCSPLLSLFALSSLLCCLCLRCCFRRRSWNPPTQPRVVGAVCVNNHIACDSIQVSNVSLARQFCCRLRAGRLIRQCDLQGASLAPEFGNFTSYTRTALASLLSCSRQSCCSPKFAFRLLWVHMRVCVSGVYVQANYAGHVRAAGLLVWLLPLCTAVCTHAAHVAISA